MENSCHIGIDLGGTNIRGGLLCGDNLSQISVQRINAQGTAEEVLNQLFWLIDSLINNSVKSIGIGVPGMVDMQTGEVSDLVNIPSWKLMPLRQLLKERYAIAVHINNDANCFALGELYFGAAKNEQNLIAVSIGTGLGTGIVIHGRLHAGANAGAGEFGMVDYLDKHYEYYASGQFFREFCGIDGETVFRHAKAGDLAALEMYKAFGLHLGNAIKMMLYCLDIPTIVLGGSVSSGWPFFQEAMWQQVGTFAYSKLLENLRIEKSTLPNAGLLGAAALYRNQW